VPPSFFVLNNLVETYYKIKQNGGVHGAPSRVPGVDFFFTAEWGDIPAKARRLLLPGEISSMQKTIPLRFLLTALLVFSNAVSLAPAYSQSPQHAKIVLKGFDGKPLSADSKVPYSPKRTCGACHDYDRITSGYHFQQGRTDRDGKIVISDTFDPRLPWNLSSGMYGKHSFACPDSRQLAKKINLHASEIDMSSFSFIENCGACHPGGGPGEYDRKGNLYYNDESKKFGYEVTGENFVLDGDYTSFSAGDITHGASWDQTGVSEADCLVCHLKGYQWKERGAAFNGRFFRVGPTLGAGWATLKSSQDESGNPKREDVSVDYTKKEIADFENLGSQIVRRTPDENCWACHGIFERRKRGGQWTAEADIHKAKGLTCLSCHPADREHNFAKGNTLQETVRNDLDNTMFSCEDCHYRKKDRKAPSYRHPFSPRHMKRIACETCHIPFQTTSADLVYDLASTGTPVTYDTIHFLSGDPLNPKKPVIEPTPSTWVPQIRDVRGRIVPVKSLIVMYWGDLDEKTNVVKPLSLWKIRGMKIPPLKDDNGDGIPEVNSLDEIKGVLKTLKGNDSLGVPVAKHPVLLKGGFLYHLDKKGEVEKIKHEQADPIDFSLSHNVASGSTVLGARGCKDCHSKNSPFFLRKMLTDPYDEKGNPSYLEMWERLGYDRDKLDRLLLEQ
jgi:hypothetical protein